MNGAFYIGATGLDAQQRALDAVANNIANVNTTAFKRSTTRFSALVAPQPDPLVASPDAAPATPQPLGVSVDVSAIDFSQGQLSQTGQAMDIAISGNGFIELMGPAGQSLLWRGGSLEVNPDGYLAASNGMALKAMITPPAGADALTIGQDGSVVATLASGATKTIGRIEIVQDKDPSTLTAATGGLYQAADPRDLVANAPGEGGAGVIVQGSIESSNVNLSDEMVELMLLQRAFSASSQVVQAGDQLMAIANSLRR